MIQKLFKKQKNIVWLTGFATFFFGFGAPAVLNLILFAIKSPLVLNLRSSLSFVSAIIGDGIILPVVNMLIASFIFKNTVIVSKQVIILGFVLGLLITLYFNIVQAVNGLVNWAMPTPWHWNFLGLWHALYMFSVSSLISFYFLLLIKKIKKERIFPKQAIFIILSLILFIILLKLDYSNFNLFG